MEARFYVRTHSGYLTPLPRPGIGGPGNVTTEVMILDRAYCHRVVHSALSGTGKQKQRLIRQAERLAAEWNQADGQE